MGSSVQFLEIFARECGASPDGCVPFARFMELALFHPQVGYYAADRERVGRRQRTDFYTASSLGPVFGELVSAAAVTLLGPRDPAAYTFVEIGAEPGHSVLQGVPHPFAQAIALRLGDALALPDRAVVFSNELFDAQPCHRLVWRSGVWKELGVRVNGESLDEVEMNGRSDTVTAIADRLPTEAPEGCHLDLPLASVRLAESLATQAWQGLFLAFDYGRSWAQLIEEFPAGTARAYFQHRQSNDLLAAPGTQDLTCDVCWDWLVESLQGNGFVAPKVESQEAFFVKHAGAALARVMATEGGSFSPRKQAIMHLLHPAHMGQKFQILHGLRD